MLLKAFYSKNVSLRHLPTEFQTLKSVRKSFDLIVQKCNVLTVVFFGFFVKFLEHFQSKLFYVYTH